MIRIIILIRSVTDLIPIFQIAACGSTYYFGDMKCVGRGIGKRETVFKQANDITSLTKQVRIGHMIMFVTYCSRLGHLLVTYWSLIGHLLW